MYIEGTFSCCCLGLCAGCEWGLWVGLRLVVFGRFALECVRGCSIGGTGHLRMKTVCERATNLNAELTSPNGGTQQASRDSSAFGE